MFRIKICGITREQDARAAAEAGADAIGLNFYEQSPRWVDRAQARRIIDRLPESVAKVGVFVNHSVQWVLETCDQLGLDYVQLHGDEPAETIGRLASRPVVRAFRCGAEGLEPVTRYLQACRQLTCLPAAVLLDASAPDRYGGTGQLVDWKAVRAWSGHLGAIRLVLAGGLRPENISQAIETARPWAVDTASGVESRPGVKDPARIAAFVQAAREAFDRLKDG